MRWDSEEGRNYVTDYERAVAHEARRRSHHGMVCGPIHRVVPAYAPAAAIKTSC